ncbi:DUF1109 domain-containing protein [Frigidibacter sp. MR17.14]|uniref:DUF1109 domain-containing protein n=1 Tax=Frigidibacter sp. MR17.14 TaxID=3126509 RepID=UPI003012D98D
MKTDALIGVLAQDTKVPERIAARLIAAAASCLALTGTVGLLILGIRPDLGQAMTAPITAMKWLIPLAVGSTGLLGALRLTRPERRGMGVVGIVAAIGVGGTLWLAAALLATPEGQVAAAIMGNSAFRCLLALSLIGLPPLLAMLALLRNGASTAPGRSGALAGLGAGGLAAAIYALHCDEDAPQFFLIWYSLGIALLSVCGAAMGRRVLRW